MYRAMPTITEDADALKRLMKQERHLLKHQRLQMLYLVASEQARTRTALAPLVGVNRETVGDWLRLCADGGRELLLTIRTPPGKQPTIPAPVVAELREHLSKPEGVDSYDEVRVWLFEQYGIAIKYETLTNFLHAKLKTSPKVVRPQHIKNPEDEATFRNTLVEQVRQVVPPTNCRPLRIWSQNASRWDLMTVRRRRVTIRGVKPVGRIHHQDANRWCFGCVAPATSEAYFQLLPKLDATNMQLFLDSVAERHRDPFNILVLDRSGAHTAKMLRIPENVALMFLPARSPELNPIERV